MNEGPSDNTRQHRAPRLGRIPDSLIDAVIDGEVDERATREILAAARRHPQQRRELNETTDILAALKVPVAAPDFTDSVIHEADRRRRYIPARMQRLITRSRVGVAAGLLIVLLGFVGSSRVWPDAPIFNRNDAPVSDIAQIVAEDTEHAVTAITQTPLATLPLGRLLEAPVIRTTAPQATYTTTAYDTNLTGFFVFPSPTPSATSRHNSSFTPAIRFVGSSAIKAPQTIEFNRDSKLP